jgi:hypothetical protein
LSPTNGDYILVQWLIEESAIIPFKIWSHGRAMSMAVDGRHTLVVKCLIKEVGADIDAVILSGDVTHTRTVLEEAVRNGNYVLAHWLIGKGALISSSIWYNLGKRHFFNLEHADFAELSSLLKVLLLLPMSPGQYQFLPDFVAKVTPQHADLCTRGRQLRDRLPSYLELQEAPVGKHCPISTVLQAMLTTYTLHTPEDLWRDGLQWL